MATLTAILGSLKIGQHDLQIRFLGWHKVGSCNVRVVDQYEFSAAGTYNALGHSGSFDVDLKLTDRDPNATSGPCTVTNAGQTVTGTYQSNGTSLVFTGEGHSVTVSSDPGGVLLQVSGYPEGRVAS